MLDPTHAVSQLQKRMEIVERSVRIMALALNRTNPAAAQLIAQSLSDAISMTADQPALQEDWRSIADMLQVTTDTLSEG